MPFMMMILCNMNKGVGESIAGNLVLTTELKT